MKPLFFKTRRLWFTVLIAGVALVAAGVLQLFIGFHGSGDRMGGNPPMAGAPVNIQVPQDGGNKGIAAKNGAEAEKNSGDKEKREAKQNDFFVEYRLERDRTRSQQIDLFREIVNNQNSPEETRKEAQRRLLAISQAIDTEMKLENLIRAENFKDAVAFIQEKTTTVIVQTPVLTSLDRDKLTEIAVRVTGLRPEDVTIIPKV